MRNALFLITGVFLATTICLLAAASGDETTPPAGTVHIRILGPDGRPLANALVNVSPERDFPNFDNLPPPHAAVKTDARGAIQFGWPCGNVQLKIEVKGHGYGTTGIVEIIPGKIATPNIPPLAPYATISGSIPDGSGAEVIFQSLWGFNPVTTTADAKGNYSIELHGGMYSVRVKKGGATIAQSTASIPVRPGEVVRDPAIAPTSPKERLASTQPQEFEPGKPVQKKISWAHGTVRDAKGHPIVAATVYASVVFQGAIRMYESAAKATTDASGNYDIQGDSGLQDASGTLVAYKPGFPPEMAWIVLPGVPMVEHPVNQPAPPLPAPPPSPPVNFTLASQGGQLEVIVAQNQKPFPGASVSIFREGGNLRDVWARGTNAPEQKQAESVAYPKAVAGPDGIAHFKDLPPGRYQIIASTSLQAANLQRMGIPESNASPTGIASAVAVRVGQTTIQHLSIYPQPNSVAFAAIRSDGKPITGSTSMSFASVDGSASWSSGIKLDAGGNGTYGFQSPGLWAVSFYYADAPINYSPIPERYYRASAVAAASPRVGEEIRIRTTALRVDAGSVNVELRDAAGNPARGIVQIGSEVGDPYMVGCTDAWGKIRFEHIQTADWTVKGWINGPGQAADIEEYGPLPPDEQLAGRASVPPAAVTPVPNQDVSITLQARQGGYIRGVLRPPAGRASADYAVYLDDGDFKSGASVAYASEKGQFVAGPFSAGIHRIKIARSEDQGNPSAKPFEQDCAVELGKVSHITVALPARGESSKPVAGGSVSIGMGGVQSRAAGAELLSGHVYLADGKTPAYGAMLIYFVPDDAQPHLAAFTDVTGTIHGRDLWYSGNPQPQSPPGSPTGPVIVAMLPGQCGASIVDAADGLDKPRSITLPPSINCKGSVTLGGAKLAGQNGQFQVLAEYQGNGKLSGVLSVWATPQPDGSFELAGLTPGKYQVQASLDNIWLSDSVTITVSADKPPAPIQLNIAQPGGPAMIHCTDKTGKPMIGVAVLIDRPAGPLTELDWPAEFTSDGAGDVWIPALEAGKHTAHFKDGAGSVDFAVPALPVKEPVVVTLAEH